MDVFCVYICQCQFVSFLKTPLSRVWKNHGFDTVSFECSLRPCGTSLPTQSCIQGVQLRCLRLIKRKFSLYLTVSEDRGSSSFLSIVFL